MRERVRHVRRQLAGLPTTLRRDEELLAGLGEAELQQQGKGPVFTSSAQEQQPSSAAAERQEQHQQQLSRQGLKILQATVPPGNAEPQAARPLQQQQQQQQSTARQQAEPSKPCVGDGILGPSRRALAIQWRVCYKRWVGLILIPAGCMPAAAAMRLVELAWRVQEACCMAAPLQHLAGWPLAHHKTLIHGFVQSVN